MQHRRIWTFLIGTVFLMALLLSGCAGTPTPAPPTPTPVPPTPTPVPPTPTPVPPTPTPVPPTPTPVPTEAAPAVDAQAIFAQQCSICHQLGGEGGSVGPALDDIGSKMDAAAIAELLKSPPKGMPPFAGSDEEIQALADFLASQK